MSKILFILIVVAINKSRAEFGKQHLQFCFRDSDHVCEQKKDVYKIQGQNIFIVFQLIPMLIDGHTTICSLSQKPTHVLHSPFSISLLFLSLKHVSLHFSQTRCHYSNCRIHLAQLSIKTQVQSPWIFLTPSSLNGQTWPTHNWTSQTAFGLFLTTSVSIPGFCMTWFLRVEMMPPSTFRPCPWHVAHSPHS